MNRHETLARISWCEWKIKNFHLTYEEITELKQEIKDLVATISTLKEKEGIK